MDTNRARVYPPCARWAHIRCTPSQPATGRHPRVASTHCGRTCAHNACTLLPRGDAPRALSGKRSRTNSEAGQGARECARPDVRCGRVAPAQPPGTLARRVLALPAGHQPGTEARATWPLLPFSYSRPLRGLYEASTEATPRPLRGLYETSINVY